MNAAYRLLGRQAHPAGTDQAGGAVTNCQRVVVGRYRDPVRKLQVVHYFPQHTVLRVLVHRAGAVGHVRPWASAPRIGKEQIAVGVEIEVVGAFEQLVAPSVDQRLQFFRLRVVDEDAAMASRQVELAIVKARALRFAGLADLRRRIAIDHGHQLAVRLQIGNPAAADPDKPQIALVVERAAFEKLALGRVADIGKFLDRPDPLRQRWQPPWLDWAEIRCWGWGLSKGRAGESTKDRDQRERQTRGHNASAHDVVPPWQRSGGRTSRNHRSDIPRTLGRSSVIFRIGKGAATEFDRSCRSWGRTSAGWPTRDHPLACSQLLGSRA